MKLERSIEQYRNSKPSVIVEGSKAQVLFALEDSRTDVLRLAAHVDRLTRELASEKESVEDLRAEVDRHSNAASASRLYATQAKDALIECEEYFDNRADADCDQDGYIPNEEMKLLQVVREALRKAGSA